MKALSQLILITLSFPLFAGATELHLNAIPESQLNRYIHTFQQKQQELWIKYDGQRYPLTLATITEDALVARYSKGLVYISFNFESGPGKNVTLLKGAFDDEHSNVDPMDNADSVWVSSHVSFDESDDGYRYRGTLSHAGDPSTEFTLNFNDSLIDAGTSQFKFDANEALLTGELGTKTYLQLKDIVQNHQQVDTIVIKAVRGSLNDDINLHTGNLLRNAGLNTTIPENGFAYSGGVDLFSAGVIRTIEPGARVGVHSWCCSDDGKTASELKTSDPAHHDQLTYFSKMLGKETGPKFYFYTLSAAPFDGIHTMSQSELKQYGLLTDQ
ncbi:hypothetical protein MD535_13090 [Vibrio sp. ZSDZ65]|uniref:Alpha/beta hydrolase n=1 Tax=Vibrio qingdaonensis TaxID=2829491 RepID=A0A9X3CNZ4_9VIBR|nr:hypothetical protein [Vibrio qingdaonensis]MCW8346934.1 hypothetical protein [Vibrio qingdaonensis]